MQSPRIEDHQLAENQVATRENILLYQKIEYGEENAAIQLLNEGGSPNWYNQSKEGATPFHLACEKGMSSLVNLMLKKQANLNSRVLTTQNAALHCAAKGGSIDVINLLLEHELDVEVRNGYGNTPLHEACLDGNIALAQRLVEAGASCMSRNHKQSTPIHFVVYSENESSNHIELLSYLVNSVGGDVNVQDEDGLTPLHVAAEKGHTGLARSLLDLNANVGILDNLGHDAIHYAEIGNHPEVKEIILPAKQEWEKLEAERIRNENNEEVKDETSDPKLNDIRNEENTST